MTRSNLESQSGSGPKVTAPIAATPLRRLTEPLVRFLEIESASGIVLIACTAAALALANSPWAQAWDAFWHIEVHLAVGSWELRASLAHWVNDGLMTIFFFLVGLEIKRELVDGELRSIKKAALPIIAALGGMLIPAGIYLLLQYGGEGQRGWGIPMATDIAFAVGVLTLLGRRVPAGLKIFLLALAIADDIGAIVIIALFYSTAIQATSLGLAALGVVLVFAMNRLGVRSIVAYSIAGAGIWLAMYNSGIHPTIAGVTLGLMTPGRAWIAGESLVAMLLDAVDRLDGQIDRTPRRDRSRLVGELTATAREAISPLERLELSLHPWVAFAVMPIFALANAGVALQPAVAGHSAALAVAAGLVVGKPLGILLFSWLAVRLGIAQLPRGVSWSAVLGAGCLGGIGFTMSLFIGGLALEGMLLEAGKIGTFAGSIISALLGFCLLFVVLPKATQSDAGSTSFPSNVKENNLTRHSNRSSGSKSTLVGLSRWDSTPWSASGKATAKAPADAMRRPCG
jgi:NhaA family Na+:H+ antiporter